MRRSYSVPCFLLLAGTWACPQPLWAQGPLTAHQASMAPAPIASVASDAAAKPAPEIGPVSLAVGTWTGTLPIAGQAVATSLAITRQGGTYGAALDIPGGTIRQRRLQVSERADTLRLIESTLDVLFVVAVSPDGQQLSGRCSWAQIGNRMPLKFHRGTVTESANSGQRVSRKAYETKWENGTLENGRPVGLWNYYSKDGEGDYVLLRAYDHTARELTYARPENEVVEAEVRPGVWEHTTLTQAPWFIGRHDALTSLGGGLTYPHLARKNRVEGKVWVTVAVDTLGRVSDHKILKGLGSGCDAEALRVARTIPDTWTPGRLGSKAVACRKTFVYVFKL